MPNYIIAEIHSTLIGTGRSLVLLQSCDTLPDLPGSANG